ncbi:MAG: hypothetical protein DCC55_26350 [Chloroflexi bacterium]|nr:MAG: hypothetical protein DCC55_26350 [Chloroflexota bacterium]
MSQQVSTFFLRIPHRILLAAALLALLLAQPLVSIPTVRAAPLLASTTVRAPATDTHSLLNPSGVIAANALGGDVGFVMDGTEQRAVMVFELPPIPAGHVLSAVIGPNVNSVLNPRGGAPYDTELVALGVRPTKEVPASDFAAAGTLIQADFLTPSQPNENFAFVSPSDSAAANLTAFLQANYTAGHYIFLKFKAPDGVTAQDYDSDGSLASGYNISMQGHFNEGRRPTLDLVFSCPTVLYVNHSAGGANTGISWADAFTNLQDALAAAAGCEEIEEIWVAGGVYYPDVGGGKSDNDRTASFQLKSNLGIYGGFAGGETSRDQRDPAANVTILSGDTDQNDTNTDGNHIAETWNDIQGNNAYNVVTGSGADSTAVLDGFTITAGKAEGPSTAGGGMFNDVGSPQLRNLAFLGNQAGNGGGMYNQFGSSPALANVLFRGNRATGDGGAIYNLTNSTPSLTDVTFSGNRAEISGGGLYNNNNGSPVLTNVTFAGNQAGIEAGGMKSTLSSPVLTNVTFSGNTANTAGALLQQSGTLTLKNTTFSGNQAGADGVILNRSGAITVTNSILANSVGGANCSGAITSGDYNLSSDASCNLTQAHDQTNVDPQLAPLADNGGATQTHALLTGSPAIDAGNCSGGTVTTDQRNVSRPKGAACDIGAVEETGPITYDYGDAPDPTYPTLKANNGARHGQVNELRLGTMVDSEADGQPNANATGDDSIGDDEDGVVLSAEINICQTATATVTTAAAGRLYGWIDFSNDGDWADPGERIFNAVTLPAGTQQLAFNVPCNATLTDLTVARFRYASALRLSYDGESFDGEVEDYAVAIRRGPPQAVDDAARTNEDRTVVIDVLANDRDPVSVVQLVSIVRPPTNGTAVIEGTIIRYTPKANFYGVDSFDYTIRNDINVIAKATARLLVLPVNDAPTDITLSNDRVDALSPIGTLVGKLATVDADTDDKHIYRLNGNNSGAFSLAGNELRTTTLFNPKKQDRYKLRISSTDRDNATFDKEFTITIFANVPLGITDIQLSGTKVAEHKPAGTLVGLLSATDPRNVPHTFTLVSGAGSQHNHLFAIAGNQLRTAAELDFETLPVASIRVQVANGVDDPYEKLFLIKLLDEPNDPPPPFTFCNGQDIKFITSSDNQTEVTVRAPIISEVSSLGCVVAGKMDIRIPGDSRATNIDFRGRVDKRGRLQSYDAQIGDRIGDFSLDPAGVQLSFSGATIEYYAERPSLRIKKATFCVSTDWGGECIPIPAVTWLIDSSGFNFGGRVTEGAPKIPGAKLVSKKGFGISRIYGNFKRVANGYEFTAGGTFVIPKFAYTSGCGLAVILTFYKDATGAAALRISTPQAPYDALTADALDRLGLAELTLGMDCALLKEKDGAGSILRTSTAGIPIGTTGLVVSQVFGTVSLRPDNQFVRLSIRIDTARRLPLPSPANKPLATIDGSATVLIEPEWGLDLAGALTIIGKFEVANGSASVRRDRFSTSFNVNLLIVKGSARIDAWTSSGNRFHFTGRGVVRLNLGKGVLYEGCAGVPCGVRWCDSPDWLPDHPCGVKTCSVCLSIPPGGITTGGVGVDFGEFTNGKYGMKGYVEVLSKQYGFYVDHKGDIDFGGVSGYMLATPPALAAAMHQQQVVQAAAANQLSLDPTLIDDRYTFVSDHEVLIKAPIGPAAIAASAGVSLVNVAEASDVLFALSADPGLSMTILTPDGVEITPGNYNQAPVAPTYQVKYTETLVHQLERTIEPDENSLARLRYVPTSWRTELESVDVSIDGSVVWSGVGLQMAEARDYLFLTPGDHAITITPVGGGAAILSTTLTTRAGQDYTLVTTGKDSPQLLVLTDDNLAPALGNAHVRFVQSAQVGAPVNILIEGTPLATHLGYGSASTYLAVPAGQALVEIQDAATGNEIAPPRSLEFETGLVYTLYGINWDKSGYQMDFGQLIDEVYVSRLFIEYDVAQARPGDWRVKLSGNLETNNYMASALGVAAPTRLSNVTVDAGDLSQTQVGWTLASDFAPAKVTVYLTTDAVTQTLTYTDDNGLPISQVVPNYTGFAVAEFTITDPAQVRSAATTQVVNLSNVPSGQYHMWVRADNDEMPPAQAYAVLPNTNEVALIHIDHSATFPMSWVTMITPTLAADTLELITFWTPLNHPDVDVYNVYVGASPMSYTRVVSDAVAVSLYDEADNLVSESMGLASIDHMRPGVTYYLVIEAVDEESGRTVRSQEVTVAYSTGDYQLTTPQSIYHVAPGSTTLIPLSLQVTQPLFFEDVPVGINGANLPAGLLIYFEDELEGPTMLSANSSLASKKLVVEVGPTVAEGSYPFTINGYNADGLERNHTITLVVGAQALQAQTMCYGKNLNVRIPVVPAAAQGGFDLVVISGPLPPNLVVDGAVTCVPYTGLRSMTELTNQLVTQGCAGGVACNAINRIVFSYDGSYRIDTIQEVQAVTDLFLPVVQDVCNDEPFCR